MKKYYYITLVAIVATVCLQVSYINSLYNRYVDEKIIGIEDIVQKLSTRERIIRDALRVGVKPKERPRIMRKHISHMTQEEIDSLRRLPGGADTIDVIAAQKAGIGGTAGEIVDQLMQDLLLKSGFPLNLNTLDSLWRASDSIVRHPHQFLLYDKDTVMISSVGDLESHTPDYVSQLHPIGTKGLQYLQIKADIPMSHFLRHQLWTLALSACMMLLVLLCLFFQLTAIRRKEALLRKREMTINGTIHDLKSPLNSVITMMGWLKQTAPDKETKEMLETSKAGVRRLISNIEALLMTARMDRHQVVLNKSLIDVPEMAEGVKKELSCLYPGKPHTICIINELPAGLQVMADGMYIENVIRNLMENALKYSDAGVRIEVSLSIVNERLRVSVKDNGWGIAPCHQRKLFTQFYRVPRSEEQQQKGYGIGLAQSQYIINEHGGEIMVKSAEGEGSTFTFIIPCR
ncbi:HAMP domain-containing sensor histidine kinase [Phocaeicola massiliensis]|uniref:sensor histidine kinase n=2 Tax=Phocaeicola massiliensis TaxID=204516 RepID=UPI00234D0BF8|nr:HAMP domain-containing sensor histidine kinase [Phocaeicola massiliensis]MDC7198155.1 HAMP domain-containing sensor histidine kinase [Phocaeicola massiliensis]